MNALFTPIKIGPYTLPNRIFMAPLSRNRATPDGIPSQYAAEYYQQRATAGLIIAESAAINASSGGMNAPGIYAPAHITAWKAITDAVHQAGGHIFLQLWHSGRVTHTSLLPNDAAPKGPSAIHMHREIVTYEGHQRVSPPQAFTQADIATLIQDHQQAAKNALAAGFDGIEIHAAGGYLVDQFLQDGTNQRDDEYGGSTENRTRFLMEIMAAVIEVWGADRVGVRLSPTGDFNEISDSTPLETFSTVINKLNTLDLAYLHSVEQYPWAPSTEEQLALNNTLRPHWSGPYIANGGFDAHSGDTHITQGNASAIAFGRPFIANPDLPARFKANAPLNELDQATLYGGDSRGYTDYPAIA